MSLYIQLTDRCNMACAHCCFSATGKGSFMAEPVFREALRVAARHGMHITLGGGEPTLHPRILEWAMEAALASADTSLETGFPSVCVITNGKKTEVAIQLAKLGHLGFIQAEVSRDIYHDKVSPRVYAEFDRYTEEAKRARNRYAIAPSFNYASRIRDVTGKVLRVGRAAENNLGVTPGCACEALFLTPSGDLYTCGCKLLKLGTIFDAEIPEDSFFGYCERTLAINRK